MVLKPWNGSFKQHIISEEYESVFIAMYDVDHDGDQDIVVSQSGDLQLSHRLSGWRTKELFPREMNGKDGGELTALMLRLSWGTTLSSMTSTGMEKMSSCTRTTTT